MVQVGAFQAQRPVLFHPQEVSLPQLCVAFRALGVAQNGKYDEVLASFEVSTSPGFIV
jgi:hypothetical protein